MKRTYTLTIWNNGTARISKTFNATGSEAETVKAYAATHIMQDGEALSLKAGSLAAFDGVLNA